MSLTKCKCSMSIKLLGDGCEVCNPELASARPIWADCGKKIDEAAGVDVAALNRRITEQAAEIERLRAVLRKASAALSLIEEVVDEPPEANCSCHLSPPCNDCVEWGGLRELFTSSSEAIKAIDAMKGK